MMREKAARVIALIVNIEAAALIVYELAMVWHQFVGVSEHYAIFFGAVFTIAVLLHIEETLRNGAGRSRAFFTAKLILLSYSVLAALTAAAYIRANVTRLETEVGLLNGVDMVVGVNALIALCVAGFFVWGPVIVFFI